MFAGPVAAALIASIHSELRTSPKAMLDVGGKDWKAWSSLSCIMPAAPAKGEAAPPFALAG